MMKGLLFFFYLWIKCVRPGMTAFYMAISLSVGFRIILDPMEQIVRIDLQITS